MTAFMRNLAVLAAITILLPRPADAVTTIVLPFGAGPDTVSLTPAWAHRSVDVGTLVDLTGTMSGELTNLKNGFTSFVMPQLSSIYPDIRFGVAEFEDWPCNGHGLAAAGDLPYRLIQRCTSNALTMQVAINSLAIRNGGDEKEAGYDALHYAITGASGTGAGCASVPVFNPANQFVAGVADGEGGGMGFRNGVATTVVMLATDGSFHDSSHYAFSGPVGRARALAELQGSGYRAAVAFSGATADTTYATARAQLRDLSFASSTVAPPAHGSSATLCETGIGGNLIAPVSGGCPDVFEVATTGAGSATAMVGAVRQALDFSPFTLTCATEGTPVTPSGTSADFVQGLSFAGGVNPAFAPAPTVSVDGDSLLGSYATGTADVRVVLENLTVPSTVISAQQFPLYVEVRANGIPVARDTIIVEIPLLLDAPGTMVREFQLRAAARNPFAGRFGARLALPQAGPISVTVCDAAGRRVRALAAGEYPAGLHSVEWDGRSDAGTVAPAGIYFMRAAWAGQRTSLRITKLR